MRLCHSSKGYVHELAEAEDGQVKNLTAASRPPALPCCRKAPLACATSRHLLQAGQLEHRIDGSPRALDEYMVWESLALSCRRARSRKQPNTLLHLTRCFALSNERKECRANRIQRWQDSSAPARESTSFRSSCIASSSCCCSGSRAMPAVQSCVSFPQRSGVTLHVCTCEKKQDMSVLGGRVSRAAPNLQEGCQGHRCRRGLLLSHLHGFGSGGGQLRAKQHGPTFGHHSTC